MAERECVLEALCEWLFDIVGDLVREPVRLGVPVWLRVFVGVALRVGERLGVELRVGVSGALALGGMVGLPVGLAVGVGVDGGVPVTLMLTVGTGVELTGGECDTGAVTLDDAEILADDEIELQQRREGGWGRSVRERAQGCGGVCYHITNTCTSAYACIRIRKRICINMRHR